MLRPRERGSLRPFSPPQDGVSDPFSHRKRENPVHPKIPLAKIPVTQRMPCSWRRSLTVKQLLHGAKGRKTGNTHPASAFGWVFVGWALVIQKQTTIHMILNPQSESKLQKKMGFPAETCLFLQENAFSSQKNGLFLPKKNAFSCKKMRFSSGGHAAENRRKSQDGFRAQESRTLESRLDNFHKTLGARLLRALAILLSPSPSLHLAPHLLFTSVAWLPIQPFACLYLACNASCLMLGRDCLRGLFGKLYPPPLNSPKSGFS